MEMKIKHRLISGVMIAVIAGGILGCSSKSDPYRSSDRVMDDKMIKDRVTTTLNNSPVYKFPHVNANAYNGIVQLNGFVHREEQKVAASEMVRSIDGVKDVVNNITVVHQQPVYGGTVNPRTGARGSATNYPPPTPQNPNQ
jgi:hypothetical protein